MPVPKGTYYRIRTYPSGKRVRLAISPSGKVLESKAVNSRAMRTRTGKRLTKRLNKGRRRTRR